LLLGEQLLDPLRDLERLRLQPIARAAELVLELAQIIERAGAGHGLDAPHALRDAGLAEDLEQPDVASAPHVGAAAELERLAADPARPASPSARRGRRAPS